MSRKDRQTPLRNVTAIIDGWICLDGIPEWQMDTEAAELFFDDKHTTSLRLVSLSANWYSNEWVTGVGYAKFDISVQMTLRKEIRSGRAHWYAYRRAGGKLLKRYVGQSDRITSKRLVEVARTLEGV